MSRRMRRELNACKKKLKGRIRMGLFSQDLLVHMMFMDHVESPYSIQNSVEGDMLEDLQKDFLQLNTKSL